MKTRIQLLILFICLASVLSVQAGSSSKASAVYLPVYGTFVVDLIDLQSGHTLSPYEKGLCDDQNRCVIKTLPCEELILIDQSAKKTIVTLPRLSARLTWRADLRAHTHNTWEACFADQVALESDRDGIPRRVAADLILTGRIEAFLKGPGAEYTDFRPHLNELAIVDYVWDRVPEIARPQLAHGLAVMCERAGYARRVSIRDISSGRFLARFGPAGYESTPTTPTR